MVRLAILSAAAAAAALFVVPAIAEDLALPATEEPAAASFAVDAWNVVYSDATSAHGALASVSIPVSEDLNIGADLTLGISADLGVGTVSLDQPLLVLRAESVVAGTFEVLDAGTALYTACVTPTARTSNFGTEDLIAFSTCTGYASGQSILYTSPAFDGVTFYASAMGDLYGLVSAGDVSQSLSAAVGLEREIDDATLTASVGVDKALSVKGGGPLPTLVQAGANIAWETYAIGVAGQYEHDSVWGGHSWSLGAGGSVNVTEQLVLNGEVAVAGYEVAGVATSDYSAGVTAEYALIEDVLWVDASLNAVRTVSGGVGTTAYSAGLGMYVTHEF
jgi:hypothetical protein